MKTIRILKTGALRRVSAFEASALVESKLAVYASREEWKSDDLKKWNRQARSVARPGKCAVIGCFNSVPKGKAFCSEHQ
jgi:beta-xylosidase